jgi:hypothetical protein
MTVHVPFMHVAFGLPNKPSAQTPEHVEPEVAGKELSQEAKEVLAATGNSVHVAARQQKHQGKKGGSNQG